MPTAVLTFLATMAALLMVEARPVDSGQAAVDPEVVGRWSCGETAIALGPEGIELSGEIARSGRVTARDGRLLIFWDSGEVSEWAYAAGEGALILGTDRGPNYTCLAAR